MAFNTQLSLSSTSSTASIYSSSLQFNSPTADIVFLSSDGVTFHLHSKNLEPTTGALPGIALPTKDPDDPVQLIETAETLAILFQYSYPQRHPELSGMEFDVIAPLAEAVEKYKVFPAQKACCMVMKSYLYERPAEVLAYAGKYKYTELADEAAPLLLTMPIEAIVKVLPPTLVVSWVLYQEEWNKVLRTAYTHPNIKLQGHGICATWPSWVIPISVKLNGQVGSLRNVKEIFAAHSPPAINFCCSRSVAAWQRSIEGNIKNISPFSTFL